MRHIGRREFLLGGSAIAAASLWPGSALAQARPVKIGAVYPLSGNLASPGLDNRRGVDLAVNIINGKYGKLDLPLPLAQGQGLPGLGGARLEIVYADSRGEPKNGQAEAERLITQDQVVAMIGAYQSAVTKTASQAAERMKIPFVCSDSTSPTLTEREFRTFFRVIPHDGSHVRDQFTFLKDLERVKKQKVETVALLYENTEFGANVGREEGRVAQELGYKVVAEIAYPANATDVTSEVGRLLKATPDVLLHASYITDAILFTKMFKEMGFAPKGLVTMGGYGESGYLPAVKGDGDAVIVRSLFSLDLAKTKPLVGKVNDLFRKEYGMDMMETASRAFTAPFILAEALNRARTTESEAVLKALLETNLGGEQVLFPWKGVRFDPKTHQNMLANGILVQTQQQAYHTVWPFESAATEVVWPFPNWRSRR